MPDFNNPIDISGIAEGHRQSTYSPIRRRDVKRVLRNYDIKVKPKQRRGLNDSQLYKLATRKVIDWWKKNQKEPKPKGSAPGVNRTSGAHTTNRTSGGGGGGGPMLPDTAMGPSNTTTPRLADIEVKPVVSMDDVRAAFQQYSIRYNPLNVPRSARLSQAAWDRYLANLRTRYGDKNDTKARNILGIL